MKKKKWKVSPASNCWMLRNEYGASMFFDKLRDSFLFWEFYIEGQMIASLYQKENEIENIDDFPDLVKEEEKTERGEK